VTFFPLGLSNGPPDRLGEIASAGINMLRTGRANWDAAAVGEERKTLDSLHSHRLKGWLWLGELTNLPAQPGSDRERLLTSAADTLQSHPALGAYKGEDEPRNPYRGKDWIRPEGLVRGYQRLKRIDPTHPLVIVHAPLSTPAQLRPYTKACDVVATDIYPVSYPPGTHAQTANHDISVVGDMTKKMVGIAAGKPVWMTLQIVWSGVIPSQQHPDHVPRFPSLPAQRFMVYDAIVNGERGLFFFGGHLTEIAPPEDAAAGWNWTFWNQVLKPVVQELSSPELAPALTAPTSKLRIATATSGMELAVREAGGFVYVIALRKSGTVGRVRFTGLPAKTRQGRVLFEYVQEPLPPPIRKSNQVFRPIAVSGGAFSDWFAPHDVHVYRFVR